MNRLKSEKSPYLLQHAGNPVDWYPWGPEALERARREDKPILLSVGYSTCHWCHVMAHESFEDRGIAKFLNENFVAIKVDREERPDLDSLYMTVCHILTGGGGWPLNVFLTPDLKPFHAGTYFPKESRFGHAGFKEILQRLSDLWKQRREDVLDAAERITTLLKQETGAYGTGAASEQPELPAMKRACEELARRFDGVHGGFGDAPKFPTAHNFFFLLRHWKRTGDSGALEMVEKTLGAMRRGGIYDPVGFGFHRYSVDAAWFLPHFEKMLYDQALLAMAYTEACQATGKGEYGQTAGEIFSYVLRDMTSPEGGFYSGEDADSEGVEGKFYLWREEEIRQILGTRDAELWIRTFNVEKAGNTDEGGRGENIFYRSKEVRELAAELRTTEEKLAKSIEVCRLKLFAAREKRVHPRKDDKILTDWNGLMIAALAKGAQVLAREDCAAAARKAAGFLLSRLRDRGGRLLHRYREGEAAIPAFLDDYAFLIWGLIELYETVFDASLIDAALDLNDTVHRHFRDPENGGYYFIADDAEELIIRKKEFYDGALPSGNSVMALNLLRLGRITGNPGLETEAEKVARGYVKRLEEMPSAYTQFLTALDFAIGPSLEIVITGKSAGKDTKAMLRAVRRPFIPGKAVLLYPTEEESPPITRLAPFTAGMTGREGKATAYVCVAQSCREPTTDIDKMMETLTGKE